MKKLKLNINYNRSEEQIKEISDIDLTVHYIDLAVKGYHERLQGQVMRTWGRLQRKLEEASEKKLKTIEIEDAEMDFLKRPVEEASFPSLLSKYIITFQENLFIPEDKPKAKK